MKYELLFSCDKNIMLLFDTVVLVAKLCLTFVTPWTIAHQDLLSIGFPMQEYWSMLPFPFPGESYQHRVQTHISCTGRWTFNTEPP